MAVIKENKYEYSKVSAVSREEFEQIEELKKMMVEKVTLESEYEKIKELDIDNWVNIRGPRPWEEQPVEESQK